MVNESDELISFLREADLSESEIKEIENFRSRDGFQLIRNEDFAKMLVFFRQYPADFENIVPIITDDNSNYICVYYRGEDKGKVCYLSHDEIDLYPRFESIKHLINSINKNPDAKDFTDLPEDELDY